MYKPNRIELVIIIVCLLLIFWQGSPAYGDVALLTNGQSCNFTDYRSAADQLIINCESSLTDSEYIDAVYRQVLKRDPDPAGKSAWMIQLSIQTRQEVMAAFLGSDEYKLICGC